MRYVFVVTYGRSGSTTLMNLLNGIDGYCIRGENDNMLGRLFELSQKAHAVHETHGHSKNPSAPWFGAHAINGDAFEKALCESFARDVLAPPAGTEVVGFKEIRHTTKEHTEESFLAYIDFLMRNFEGLKIIFNTRDAEQVARSGWWVRVPRDHVLQVIRSSDRWFAKAAEKYPEATFTIDYDEFARDHAGYRRVLDWLGVSMTDEEIATIADQKLVHLQPTKKVPPLIREARQRWRRFKYHFSDDKWPLEKT